MALRLLPMPTWGMRIVDPRPIVAATAPDKRYALAHGCVKRLAVEHPLLFARILAPMGGVKVPRLPLLQELLDSAGGDLSAVTMGVSREDAALVSCLCVERNADLISARLGIATGSAAKRGRGFESHVTAVVTKRARADESGVKPVAAGVGGKRARPTDMELESAMKRIALDTDEL